MNVDTFFNNKAQPQRGEKKKNLTFSRQSFFSDVIKDTRAILTRGF